MNTQLLKSLVEAHGIAGREDSVRAIVMEAMKPLVDEMRVDHMGNVIGHKKGDGAHRAIIMGHMDEIGFLVSHIDKDGFLRVLPVGGWDARTMMAQRVMVHGRQDMPGVFGIPKPTHILTDEERKKTLEVRDYYIDLGLPGDKVKELVEVGDWVTMWQDMVEIGDMLSSKTMDDRVGVYVMLEALRQAKNSTADIYAVASVQEEVGLRGAQISAFDINATVGLALDVTLAVDTPGVPEHEHVTKMGAGTAIKIMDSSAISDPRLVKFCRQLANERNIKHQIEILPRGGTDAGGIQRAGSGAPVITISIPTRYIHSVVESVHKGDLQASVDLVAAFIEEAHKF
ncbi:MAG: M42 family metallopeptidase [Chloroflexota bacterium]